MRQETVDRVMTEELAESYAVDVLRVVARTRCRPSNCGTVCPCDGCRAKKALEYYEAKRTRRFGAR